MQGSVKQCGDQRVASAKGAHVLATSFPPSVYRPQLKAATFGFKYREVRPVSADAITQYLASTPSPTITIVFGSTARRVQHC